MPQADSTAARRGRITRLRPSWRATSVTCRPAAPPNASIANRRGSTPRRTETSRMPSAMRVLMTRWMPLRRGHRARPRELGHAVDRAPRPRRGRAGHARRGSCRDRESPAPDWHRSRSPRCRRGRSRPGRARRRRFAGPTCSTPPASTRAIEPPPAPMLTMSRLWQGNPLAGDAARSEAICALPSTTSETSVLVPPMSNGMRLALAEEARRMPAAGDAAGRPESTAPAASRTESAIGATPPWDWMIRTGPANPASAQPAREPGQIARQRRADIGVDDGGGDPLDTP